MNTLITIREASDLLGVSIKTLRRWEQQGKITSIRTRGGHRRFRPGDLLQSGQETRFIVGYARVNRPEQKPQLDTQIKALEDFCSQQGQPLKMICHGEVKSLVLTHAESVSRFCHDFILGLCGIFKIQVILLNQPQKSIAAEDLVEDIQSLVTICYNSLYPIHDQAHQQLLEHLGALKNIRVG